MSSACPGEVARGRRLGSQPLSDVCSTGVMIHCDADPGIIVGKAQRLGVTVQRGDIGVEDHQIIENRVDDLSLPSDPDAGSSANP